MPNKLYTFVFSPPARIAKFTAFQLEVDTEHVEVNLAAKEQLTAEFIKINPKHLVPAFDHNGKYVVNSRDIARYSSGGLYGGLDSMTDSGFFQKLDFFGKNI